jgi:hypothetical protein
MSKCLRLYFLVAIFFLINFSLSFTKINKFILSEETVQKFFNYISAERKSADKFLITEDGTGTFVWVCPQTLCFPAGESFYLKPCSKFNENKPCKILAHKRKITLINSDKSTYNSIKFKSGDSFNEVKNKLRKHGFID